jgi:hypothetical protein
MHCCHQVSAAYLFIRIVGSPHLKMSAKEQRSNIKLCFAKWISFTLLMLKEVYSYGKAGTKKRQVYERHKRFRDGRSSVNNDPCCWRPSNWTNDENIERVVRSDLRPTRYLRKLEYQFEEFTVFFTEFWIYSSTGLKNADSSLKSALSSIMWRLWSIRHIHQTCRRPTFHIKRVQKGKRFVSAKNSLQKRQKHWQNVSKSFTNDGKSLSLPKGTYFEGMLRI